MKWKRGDKVGIVACSNGLPETFITNLEELLHKIRDIGLEPVCSDFLFKKSAVFSGTGKERGKALMDFYENPEIAAIFDISGGDLANEILFYIDFEVIKNNRKPFFGYSDLTVFINAVYTKTNIPSYLYPVKNLIASNKEQQTIWFKNSFLEEKNDIFDISYNFIQGNKLEGIVVGGNIRCFLKLAGTPYMPDLENKILLLESLSGEMALITSLFNQLKLMGAFHKINGLLLGTFTNLEKSKEQIKLEELVPYIVEDKNLPIVKTGHIGHGSNSKCILIGSSLSLQ